MAAKAESAGSAARRAERLLPIYRANLERYLAQGRAERVRVQRILIARLERAARGEAAPESEDGARPIPVPACLPDDRDRPTSLRTRPRAGATGDLFE